MGSQGRRSDKLLFSALTPCVVLSELSVLSLPPIPLFLSMRQDLTIGPTSGKYGYALRGVTSEVRIPFLGHGQRVNAIIGICTIGVIAMEMTTSSVNADIFF